MMREHVIIILQGRSDEGVIHRATRRREGDSEFEKPS